jgi:hypothetical protein
VTFQLSTEQKSHMTSQRPSEQNTGGNQMHKGNWDKCVIMSKIRAKIMH